MKEEDDNMLIFKILCIILLILFIFVTAIGAYSFTKALNSGEYEYDADKKVYMKYLIKLSWVLLIFSGTILIYVIMN